MAISDKLQSTLMAKSADRQFYGVRDNAAAQAKQDELRATGLYRRVEVRTFNNGSRARPLTGYFINVWFRDGLTDAEREAAKAGKAPAPVAKPKPVVARMARYEAAYQACHGRTVSVSWSGEAVRVLEHGGDPAYAIRLDADELDAISERMEAKVAKRAADREAAANAPDDIFEALGLAKSAGESAK